jgi:hypothetical protein
MKVVWVDAAIAEPARPFLGAACTVHETEYRLN